MDVTIKVAVPALGQLVREKRLRAGLQPARVAADAGMSVSNLYLIESGKAQTLPEETLKRLSDAIGFDFVSEVYRIACGVGHND